MSLGVFVSSKALLSWYVQHFLLRDAFLTCSAFTSAAFCLMQAEGQIPGIYKFFGAFPLVDFPKKLRY